MKRDRFGAVARFVLAAALLVLLYLTTGGAWIPGLLAFLVLLPPVSLCANLCVRKKICGAIHIPTTAAKGTANMGMVILKNEGWLPAAKLYCKIALVNDLTGERQTLELITAIAPRSETRRDFLLESPYCGRVFVYVESVRILDYFGLIALKVPMKAHARITILPELFSCETVLTSMSAVSDDATVSRRGDDRTEVFQLREYQSGDDIRQIHWKLSSKLDTLLLREPSQSVSRSLLVFWDKRCACSPAQMDALAETAASIGQALCDSGTAFDLCWTEKDDLELRQIQDGESLLQTIPALVTQAGLPECRDPDFEGYGRVLYLTSQLSDIKDAETVLYLVCSEEAYDGGNCLVFSPQTYREQLERLEI